MLTFIMFLLDKHVMVNYSVYGFVLNTVIGLTNYNAHEIIKQTNNVNNF